MAYLEVRHLSKGFVDFPVLLQDVSLSVDKGKILGIVGQSGCGKTTLLRCLAGLEVVDGGTILIDGEDVTKLPPQQRGVGLMFQGFALWPHMNVWQNIAFGLEVQHKLKAEITRVVGELLAIMDLAGYDRKKISELSHGQKQRVALARCLAPGPRVLLLDEPMSSLDAEMKSGLIRDLKQWLTKFGMTTVYVSHDEGELVEIAAAVWKI